MIADTDFTYVIDFDGTVTTNDISSELAAYYGGTTYNEIEEKYRRREIPIKEWLRQIVKVLPPDLKSLLSKSLLWAEIRPGFNDFLDHAREMKSTIVIASDGFGFYIEPILDQFNLLEKIDFIYRNDTIISEEGTLKIINPHAHTICPVCGNCKASHVLKSKKAGKPVIYVGDGSNDRFGAFWSDLIWARDRLAEACKKHHIYYSPWNDFYDIIKLEKPVLKDCSDHSLCLPDGRGIKEKYAME